jgi:hypothetical protein
MNEKTGLWIDHEKAVIVSLSGETEETILVEANYRNRFRVPSDNNDSRPNGRSEVSPEDIKEREAREHLNLYYDEVISHLRTAASFIVFGPGEAKMELVKRMEKYKLETRIREIDTVGRMSPRQIAAKVRDYFNRNRNGGSKKVMRHNMADSRSSQRVPELV